jgi:hypothetical protein
MKRHGEQKADLRCSPFTYHLTAAAGRGSEPCCPSDFYIGAQEHVGADHKVRFDIGRIGEMGANKIQLHGTSRDAVANTGAG